MIICMIHQDRQRIFILIKSNEIISLKSSFCSQDIWASIFGDFPLPAVAAEQLRKAQ